MSIGHPPVGLITDYAAGRLPPGMSLLIASHLGLCPACRDKVAKLEALCGALMAEADAVDPAPRCLAKALARLADGDAEPTAAEPDDTLPPTLCRALAKPLCGLRWQTVMPGLAAFRIDGFPAEKVGLIRAAPGICLQGDSADATLVLAGQISDGTLTYDRGGIAFGGGWVEVGPDPCLCLVVQPKLSA